MKETLAYTEKKKQHKFEPQMDMVSGFLDCKRWSKKMGGKISSQILGQMFHLLTCAWM